MISNKWTALIAGVAIAATPLFATAQEEGGTKTARELRASYDKALQGKTIAYLPIALGVPLSDEWGRVVQEEAEWRGMKYIVRDPNNSGALWTRVPQPINVSARCGVTCRIGWSGTSPRR